MSLHYAVLYSASVRVVDATAIMNKALNTCKWAMRLYALELRAAPQFEGR